MISRRTFLRWLAGLSFASFFPFQIREARGQAGPAPPGVGKGVARDLFPGETLHYEIAFWLIKKVALARLTVVPGEQPGRYVATLDGETLGVLGFLARYRVDSYRAVMEEIDGGRRLRSLSFEEYVKVGKRVRRNIHTFDHKRRIWTHKTIRASGATSEEVREIPEGKAYDDFLTAAFNFRLGVYGPVERGKVYDLATFPRKDVTSYRISVASKAEEDRVRASEQIEAGREYLIELSLDPEVVNSKEGAIEGWLSKDVYPVEGTIRDVILFGDVHGKMVKREPVPPHGTS